MISISFTKSGPVGIGRNELREVGRMAVEKVAEYWWRKTLPLHFTKSATRKYNYKLREGEVGLWRGSYSWKKLHKKSSSSDGVAALGEVKPLVWSGRSRELATSTRSITSKAPNYQTFVGYAALNAPMLNRLASRGMGYNELRATTPDEDAMHARIFAQHFEKQLNKRGRTRVTRIAAK